MELKIQFGEEARFDVPLRQTSRTGVAMFSGMNLRPWFSSGWVRSRLRNVIVKHGNRIKLPTGFQNETGFHFGTELDE